MCFIKFNKILDLYLDLHIQIKVLIKYSIFTMSMIELDKFLYINYQTMSKKLKYGK